MNDKTRAGLSSNARWSFRTSFVKVIQKIRYISKTKTDRTYIYIACFHYFRAYDQLLKWVPQVRIHPVYFKAGTSTWTKQREGTSRRWSAIDVNFEVSGHPASGRTSVLHLLPPLFLRPWESFDSSSLPSSIIYFRTKILLHSRVRGGEIKFTR